MNGILPLVLLCLPLQGEPADIAGVYSIVGREGDNAYIGSANIHKSGDGYAVQMAVATIEDGEIKSFSTVLAVGLRSGDKLSIAWTSGKVVGVTVYQIEKGGVLAGTWMTLPGTGTVRTETLKRIGPLPLPKPGGGA